MTNEKKMTNFFNKISKLEDELLANQVYRALQKRKKEIK